MEFSTDACGQVQMMHMKNCKSAIMPQNIVEREIKTQTEQETTSLQAKCQLSLAQLGQSPKLTAKV